MKWLCAALLVMTLPVTCYGDRIKLISEGVGAQNAILKASNIELNNIIKNGADGAIMIKETLETPDAFALTTSLQTSNGALFKPKSDDPLDLLRPIAYLGFSPIVVGTSTDRSYKTIEEMVADYRATGRVIKVGGFPGYRPYCSLVADWIRSYYEIETAFVTYKVGAQLMPDLYNGITDLVCRNGYAIEDDVASGKVRWLLNFSDDKSGALANVPQVDKSIQAKSEHMLMANRNIDQSKVDFVVDALKNANMKEQAEMLKRQHVYVVAETDPDKIKEMVMENRRMLFNMVNYPNSRLRDLILNKP